MKTIRLSNKSKLSLQLTSLISAMVISSSFILGGVVNANAKNGVSTKDDVATTATAETTQGSATQGSTTNSSGSSTTSNKAAKQAANQQARLGIIINRGNAEIERRLATLSTLTNKVNSAVKLTPSDKTTLSNEVSSTISGLTSLKTQLDADTTVADAHTDVESIFTEYRVYAIVAPKIELIKVADDQQVAEAKLSSLATKLNSRITQAQQSGKSVSTMQTELKDMNSKIAAAQGISPRIEATVIGLEPSDYNSNHEVLSGDNAQLKLAHQEIISADNDAKQIVSQLKAVAPSTSKNGSATASGSATTQTSN